MLLYTKVQAFVGLNFKTLKNVFIIIFLGIEIYLSNVWVNMVNLFNLQAYLFMLLCNTIKIIKATLVTKKN